MDRLVPLCGQTGCAAILITRETEDPDGGSFFSGPAIKVKGGKAIYYDSSLVVRVTRDSYVQEKQEKGPALLYGERHCVEIHKTKIGGKEERLPAAYFNTSNGTAGPLGFDHARDLLDVAIEHGIVDASGAHLSLGKRKLGQGKHKAVARLYEDLSLLAALEAEVAAEVRRSIQADAKARGEAVPA
jgi:hypothetical protein